jgi:dihydrodipicolinate synthase/N-acetylneuraminate lyase
MWKAGVSYMKRYNRSILGTCCVPWDDKLKFAETIFRRQVKYLLKNGTINLYVFGTAGEGYAVSDKQFRRITEVFFDEMTANQARPMVGVINLSATTVVERIKFAYDLGVRDFQISLPSWGACTFDEIRRFFGQTCGQFNDCSFLHYNLVRSQRLITPEEYALLADEFENLVATKNGLQSVSEVTSLLTMAPTLQHFLTENGFALASLLGLEAGLLISISSINWKTAQHFYQICLERQYEQIAGYLLELNDIKKALFDIIGNQGHMDGVYDKLFSKMLDEEFPLRLLPPYCYAQNESYYRFSRFLEKQYPHWTPLSKTD